ncbi:glycosyl hydrolase family 95 catalytic domain-containing protein [Flagellimonas sp.]|uniref:glycosyl hydrolase family 95 catalytic domain-containing protein n=1 Tax=Flagellimonas sp. TaxID=2058762 RepID=UPI003B50E7FE
MRQKVWILSLWVILMACGKEESRMELVQSSYDLHFDGLPEVWDEGIPLGNGMVGALIWQKEGKLRFSLDRADLWDLRPMENLNAPEWKYQWVYEQWKKNDYQAVQDKFDVPYDNSPAPSKIPAAALEFDVSTLGEVEYLHLYIKEAVCEIKWKSGVMMQAFVHATKPLGWYRFMGLDNHLSHGLVPPPYVQKGENNIENPVTGQDLRRLGYPKGTITKNENSTTYEQKGWGGFEYQVNVTNVLNNGSLDGCWSISSKFPGWDKKPSASKTTAKNIKLGIEKEFGTHKDWWDNFWSKSNIHVPDTILQKQWYLEQYKFGSAARLGAPPIALQAVWTADNGKLPPWKGDFHHDLNTQLSYWPAYSGNHLEEEIGFINWLWKYRETFKKYTKTYFGTEGLNVPGVTTLTGEPMGGWIQYSFGPTVSAWLGHHFYLHWRYSVDRVFLEQRAYPWIKDVAIYLENISEISDGGMRKLPISSSPEIHNNNREAWFGSTTNFDLSLIKWTYEKAAEMALELGKTEEANKWEKILSEWPDLAVDEQKGLMIAPNTHYNQSHRHFSHQLGYHPLGIVDVSMGENHRQIVENTIKTLDEEGSDWWVGYSFSWLGGMKARAFDGEGAAETLRKFATSFCLPNSFHVNGDQSGNGYSKFTYRPFTLEGNFAFASGLQEMLVQSHRGVVHIFPAIPSTWEDVGFDQLRTEGAFLVSAQKEKGQLKYIKINADKGGTLKIKNPFGDLNFECSKEYQIKEGNIIELVTSPGETIDFILEP